MFFAVQNVICEYHIILMQSVLMWQLISCSRRSGYSLPDIGFSL